MTLSLQPNVDSGSILLSGVEKLRIGNNGTISTVDVSAGVKTVLTGLVVNRGSFKNKIINGNFDVWQRGTSTTISAGTGAYLADRWRGECIGSSAVVSRQPFQTSSTYSTPPVSNNPKYYHRSVVTSVAGAGNYALNDQHIEGVDTLSGQTVTLTFWAKTNASQPIGVALYQFYGTGGSPSTIVGYPLGKASTSTSWQKFTFTCDLQSVAFQTIGTNNNDRVIVRFWYDAGTTYASTSGIGQQSGTFDIAQVQLTSGSVDSEFEVLDLGITQALCDRYYTTIGITDGVLINNGPIVSGYTLSGNEVYRNIPFRQRMRKLPTVTITAGSTGNSGGAALNSFTVDSANIQNTITTTGIGFSFFSLKADAEIV